MATKEDMSLIIDNDIPINLGDVGDVDDLFGDGGALPLRTPGMQLDQRVDRLRNRGCYQTVAWSRVGTIASIAPDGIDLELRYLRCRPDNGEWELSEPTVFMAAKGTPENPLVHLEWSLTNNPELAIFDASGRVCIWMFSTTLTQPYPVKKWDEHEHADDLGATVGAHWLPVSAAPPTGQPGTSSSQAPSRPNFNVLFGPANKIPNGSYQYESSFMHAEGPNHPLPARTALLTVTMGGILKLFWVNGNKMEETTLELESISSGDEILTHAAFASEKKCLILVLATASRQLKFVRVEIHWGTAPVKAAGAQGTRYSATLVEKHCATTSWPSDSPEDTSIPDLSQLLALPSILDNSGKGMVPPMVLSVRSRPPNSGPLPAAHSIIDRWEVVEQRPGLHPSIEQLGNRRNSVSSEPSNSISMRALDPIIISKFIVGIQSAQFGKMVILTFSDGTIEYRDRFTFEEMYTTRETSKISNLRQVGWDFAEEIPCQQVAFSPTFCSMVLLGEDGKLKWIKLQYSDGDFGNTMQDEQYSATVAGLTITAAASLKYQANIDDMLAVLRPHHSKKKLVQDWVNEIIRILNIAIDYSGEHSHDSLLRNEQIRSCLGILIGFGYNGDGQPRTYQSTHALLAAAARGMAWNITVATSPHFQVGGKKSPLDDHEVVEILCASVKWSLDLVAWLTDSLFWLMNDEKFMQLLVPQRAAELAAYLHTNSNNVSLQLLLCSSSRSFLMALCRRVAHMGTLSRKALEFYRRQSAEPSLAKVPNPYLRDAYQRLQQVSSEGLVGAMEFDKLANTLKMSVTQAYDNVLPTMVKRQPNPPQGKQEDEAIKVARAQCETKMLLAAAPHPGLIPVVKKFFTEDVRAFRATTDPSKLFFAKYEIVDVCDETIKVGEVRSAHLDVMSKTKLQMTPKQQWRRCTRCNSVMEELTGRGPGLTLMFNQQRRCFCSGTWALLPPGNLS